MTDEERMTLLHAELDGDLTSQQRAELARLLLTDPRLRRARDELRNLATRLDALGQADPPAQLKDSILRQLPPAAAVPTVRRGSSAGWRLAAMVAGVLIAGTIVYETVQGPAPGSRETSGTMAAGAPAVVDSVALSGVVTGRATLYRDKSGLALGLDVSAAEPLDVVIAAGGESFRVTGLRATGTAAARRTVALPDWQMQGQDLELSFLMGGHTVAHATLRTIER